VGESKVGRCGLPAHTGKGRRRENLRGLKEERGWAGLRREERGEGEGFLFFLNSFQIHFFKLSNFNQTEIHAFES
jgi:hypothetical protein